MNGSANFSPSRRYRYALRRIWNTSRPSVLFVGLNPSTADATVNDPTITRCIRFAQDWNFGSLVMANLFAYRATEPGVLPTLRDPVGPRNNWWLSILQREAGLIVAAWGIHGTLRNRNSEVLAKLAGAYCLGLTKAGHPRHPLYLPSTVMP